MKSLSDDVLAQIAARQRSPVLLFEFYILTANGTADTRYYARSLSDVTFPTGGQVYTARAINCSDITQSPEGQIQSINLTIDDVDGTFRDLILGGIDFKDKKLEIKRVYLDCLENDTPANYYTFFTGVMESPSSIDKTKVEISAVSGSALETRITNWKYLKLCPWKFGGTECNTNGLADLGASVLGTADAGSSTTLLIDTSELTQVDNHWKYGAVRIISVDGLTQYLRRITASNQTAKSVTLDVALPISCEGLYYIVWKGCDQTFSTCSQADNFGPSADNHLNFGGFLHIPIVKPDKRWINDGSGRRDFSGYRGLK